ncbi:MAG: TetR/AcrR family transcriptional regulator [Mangrovicoccus sp.]
MSKTKDKPHHHGDLRNALIRETISMLDEIGAEAISLRKLAAKAGVSHAAPTHHFGNLAGLLAAVAAEGYRRFRLSMVDAVPENASDQDRLFGICRGYLRFAEEHPALLDLMFRIQAPEKESCNLDQEGSDSYEILRQAAAPFTRDPTHARVVEAQIWSLIHGYAVLRMNSRLGAEPDDPAGDLDQILGLLEGLWAK